MLKLTSLIQGLALAGFAIKAFEVAIWRSSFYSWIKGRSDMSPLETMITVLQEQFPMLQEKPKVFYTFADGLRGARKHSASIRANLLGLIDDQKLGRVPSL